MGVRGKESSQSGIWETEFRGREIGDETGWRVDPGCHSQLGVGGWGNFFYQVKVFSFINMTKSVVCKGYTKRPSSTKSTQSSIQRGTFCLYQKKTREQRLHFNCKKLDSAPSKALLFLSLQTTHINAIRTMFQALCFFLLLPLFQLSISSFIDLGITKGVLNHLNIYHHNLIVSPQCRNR